MQLRDKKSVYSTQVFDVEQLTFAKDEQTLAKPYHRLVCPDWVNILPVTFDRQAVLIRQFRAGSLKYVLETPGGMIDPGEKDPTMAALRELEEETGFTSQRLLSLGAINPNPALQNNRVHFFLALSASLHPNRQNFPDADEKIQLSVVPLQNLDEMVRTGQIDHALSALCIMLAGKYVDIGSPKPRS